MIKETVSLDTRIRIKLTDLLFQNMNLSQGIVIINGLVVYLILYRYLNSQYLGMWLITILTISLLRMLLARFYWKKRKDSRSTGNTLILFFAVTYLSAAVWGLLIFLTPENAVWIESFIAFVIAGMSAGSLITSSARLSATVPYLVLILIPLLFYYAETGDPQHLAMIVMVMLFMFLLIRLAFRIHNIQFTSMKAVLENADMYQVLKQAKQEADDMRIRLEKEVKNLPTTMAQLDVFFDLSPNLLCVTDVGGKFIQANPAFREIAGMDENNYQNKTIIEYLHTDDATELGHRLEGLKKGIGKIHCQLRFKYADNDYQLTDFHINYDKDLYYFYGKKVA